MPQRVPDGLLPLLANLDWFNVEDWWDRWERVGGLNLARDQWSVPVVDGWVAFVGLPLLSRVESAVNCGERVILGVSALPGCGKSTLCSWVKSASQQLGWPVEHLSLDDFYWPAELLDKRMQGNPWSVPRALPGSHDIDGLLQSLDEWKTNGQITAPRFDKSLRNGRGDRYGSSSSRPQVVLMEGWFLGVSPLPSIETEILEALSEQELSWRSRAVSLLADYQEIWAFLDDLWHLRAVRSDLSSRWKQQQLVTLEQQSGVGYRTSDLSDFNRMVLAVLPPSWLRNLRLSSAVMDLTESRDVREIHVLNTQLSASSSSATG
ncbi:kinase [Synechococcus sp. BIOS-E4-1]|uniref:kinase n=1 Tax=Synechococcus sp. BIOS-E4-1 TaxID=1400864 RepID=UPI0016480A7F|nr:kinase [Synechococcus sp. BIOS-E4-1]